MSASGDSELLFEQGLQAYGRGDSAAAESAFRTLVDQGHEGTDVLYNLGTAALAQGKVGEAIYALEQARRAVAAATSRPTSPSPGAGSSTSSSAVSGEEPFVERVANATSAGRGRHIVCGAVGGGLPAPGGATPAPPGAGMAPGGRASPRWCWRRRRPGCWPPTTTAARR